MTKVLILDLIGQKEEEDEEEEEEEEDGGKRLLLYMCMVSVRDVEKWLVTLETTFNSSIRYTIIAVTAVCHSNNTILLHTFHTGAHICSIRPILRAIHHHPAR